MLEEERGRVQSKAPFGDAANNIGTETNISSVLIHPKCMNPQSLLSEFTGHLMADGSQPLLPLKSGLQMRY